MGLPLDPTKPVSGSFVQYEQAALVVHNREGAHAKQ